VSAPLSHQFADTLSDVPVSSPPWSKRKDATHVRHVPVSALDHVYSAEYEVPARDISRARSERLRSEANYSDDLRHPADVPGAHEALRDDIRAKGIHTPVDIVHHEGGDWSIRNGSHRVLAAQELGHDRVPVTVRWN
jgi:hypothetical protein